MVFSSKPVWADLYIFYETNKIFFIPNRSAHKIYFSAEPVSLKRNSLFFLRQFDQILGSIASIYFNRNKFTVSQPGLPWHIGISFEDNFGKVELKFNDLANLPRPHINQVSIITSSKNISQTHQRRLIFINQLSQLMGPSLKIYGRGFNPVTDKAEVLSKYRYHIALENTEQPNHWSEKLSDPLLALNRVFYFGCSNVNDYFSPNVVRTIDIGDPRQVAAEISEEISNNYWDTVQDDILSARNKVLVDYNLINIITSTNLEKVNRNHKVFLIPDIAYLPRKISRKISWFFKKRYRKYVK